MLFGILVFIHVVVCLVLIGVVLLQTGKRADLAGAFGGGGSQTAFGTRGAATILSKMTTISAVMFMVTSISLAVATTRNAAGSGKSVLDSVPVEATQSLEQDSIEPDVDLDDGTVPVDDGTTTSSDPTETGDDSE